MQKIIAQALTLAGFKNADEIVNVIMATPNPTVATEMILGCYVPNESLIGCYKKGTSIYKVRAVDELLDKVIYERNCQKTKTIYYLTKEDRENGVFIEEYKSGYHSNEHVPTAGANWFDEDMTIAQWERQGFTPITESEYTDTLMKWVYPVPEEEIAVV